MRPAPVGAFLFIQYLFSYMRIFFGSVSDCFPSIKIRDGKYIFRSRDEV